MLPLVGGSAENDGCGGGGGGGAGWAGAVPGSGGSPDSRLLMPVPMPDSSCWPALTDGGVVSRLLVIGAVITGCCGVGAVGCTREVSSSVIGFWFTTGGAVFRLL